MAARILEAGFLSRYHPLLSTRLACVTHPLGAVILALFGRRRGQRVCALPWRRQRHPDDRARHAAAGDLRPENYGYRLGIIGAPARMAQAVAPLAFGLLIDVMGSRC